MNDTSAETHVPNPLDSKDIAKVLSSDGPVVKCVLLKAPRPPGNGDTKPSANSTDGESSPPSDNDKDGETPTPPTPRVILKDLMEEIEVDTTPSKSMVSQVLGGPFTFLGQYEDEGIVLMIRKLPIDLDAEELADLKPSLLRDLCKDRDISMDNMLEKSDLIKALTDWSKRADPPFNPHQLQPPLHNERVRGDILVLKVAETKEELDSEDAPTHMEIPSNDEFFLNYRLDEYIQFASRTDIPEFEVKSDEDGEGSADEDEEGDEAPEAAAGEDDDDEEGLPIRPGDEEELDDEDKAAMFNLVMNEVLRQYREEHGRGPDTKELLEMRATIAKELDVKVAEIDAEQADWNKHAKLGTPAKETPKTIGFSEEDKILEYEPDPNEHNHHEEYDVDDENGYEGESASDEDDNEPPTKRLKTGDVSSEEIEQEDSKPAAVTKAPATEAGPASPLLGETSNKGADEDPGGNVASSNEGEKE